MKIITQSLAMIVWFGTPALAQAQVVEVPVIVTSVQTASCAVPTGTFKGQFGGPGRRSRGETAEVTLTINSVAPPVAEIEVPSVSNCPGYFKSIRGRGVCNGNSMKLLIDRSSASNDNCREPVGLHLRVDNGRLMGRLGRRAIKRQQDNLQFALSGSPTKTLATQTFVNTVGSDDKTAISGFDTVAFFTEEKAIRGSPAFEHSYRGAKWRFSNQEHLKLFQVNPEKFMPEWGGQCAWAVSESGSISPKKLSGSFEFIEGKLYLFAFGNRAADSARDSFLYGQWPADMRIRDGNKYWPELKRKLEEGVVVQPNSSNYRRSEFE